MVGVGGSCLREPLARQAPSPFEPNNLCFCQIQTLLIFAKKENFCATFAMPRDLPPLRAAHTLPRWADATGFPHLAHTSSPCFSFSALAVASLQRACPWYRHSFGGTFAKWPDACLEYIFMFAKKAMRVEQNFSSRAGPLLFPPTYTLSMACLPSHPPDSQLPLVHLYILSAWYSDSNLWEIACQRTRKAAFCVF